MSWQRLFENPTRKVGGVLIRTDDKWKDFVYGYDVPKRVLAAQFDHLDDAAEQDGFFKYNNTWYHTSDFIRTAGGGAAGSGSPELQAAGWDGVASDSMSTGVVIKISSDRWGDPQYKVGSYRVAPR